jgi:hypothetical protein
MPNIKNTLVLLITLVAPCSFVIAEEVDCINNKELVNQKVKAYGKLTGWFDRVENTVRFDIKNYQNEFTIEQTYVSLVYTDWSTIGGSGTSQASLVVSYPRLQACLNSYPNKMNESQLEYLKGSIFIIPQASSENSNKNIPKVVTNISVENNQLVIEAKRHSKEDASNFPSIDVKYHAMIENNVWKLKEVFH